MALPDAESRLSQLWTTAHNAVVQAPAWLLALAFIYAVGIGIAGLFFLLHLVSPKPRSPRPSEKTYRTTTPAGPIATRALPCWFDTWLAHTLAQRRAAPTAPADPLGIADFNTTIEPAAVRVSVVVPAFNEEARIEAALDEAVAYLDEHFGRAAYEILVVDDGSSDRTADVTLAFAAARGLHDVLRYITLESNRGKGGAVTHGLRHVRGEYALFADADGASKFSCLGSLIEACEKIADGARRGVAIGSRAHLVGSDAVVMRSPLRNFLMRGFHFTLSILTPPATSRIRDTQCGFKLFTRSTLPHIVPFMHAEGWIFDIEMLMLAESAPPCPLLGADGRLIGASSGIRVAQVPVDWSEVPGSKLNVVDASIRMAVGLAVLRASWMLGVYRRRVADA